MDGNSVSVNYTGSLVLSNVSTINFSGSGVAGVTDEGSGEVKVNIEGGGSSTPGVDVVYNTAIRYVASSNATHRLELTSTGDYFGSKSWTRSGTTLTITSTSHGLSTGDYVMVRNANEDYVYDDVTVSDVDTFTITVANSGGTSGNSAAYIPAFGGTVTESSGDVSAVTITAPGALSGSCQLHSLQIFGNLQTTNTQITLPTGTKEGAGGYTGRLDINLPHIVASSLPSNGNIATYTVGPRINTGASQNVLTLVGFGDAFGPAMAKVSFF